MTFVILIRNIYLIENENAVFLYILLLYAIM